MAGNLDMSLDDIIKKRKRMEMKNDNSESGNGQRFDQKRSNPRFLNRIVNNKTPFSTPTAMPVPEASYAPNLEGGTKLYLSNLDYGVSNKDIMILFSEVGDVKRYGINYDKSGRSKGTAEVVFVRHSDALEAMSRYNNLRLDGKPMKIELVGVDLVGPILPLPNSNRVMSPKGSFARNQVGYVPGAVRDNDHYGHARGRGHGRVLHGKSVLTAKELDAELESYHLTAKQNK